MSNEELDYGFLPENNKKFLDEYDNGDIMTLIKKISTENNIFESLPERFIFTTGAGGWRTEINLKKDGTFTGQFIDYELMMKQVTISEFNGKFNDVKKIDEYTYSMRLEYLNLIKGEPYYQNGLQYIYDTSTCPYGLDNANDFMIYLPGISIANLPQDFINWTTGHISAKSLQKVLPDGYYGIYNVGGKEGFIGKFDY